VSIEEQREEILEVTQRLLMAITSGDWDAYCEICDPSLTAFEPEALGYMVHGLDFHHYYFKLDGDNSPVQSTIAAPYIRIIGDVGIIAYTRLTQKTGPNGPVSSAMEETRVFQKIGGKWTHVHFHRSKPNR
jgi:calcium/calmodulin-dependent protein kinase (CaM kinase) II